MVFEYKTVGVCARGIQIEVEGNTIKNVFFQGGCSGNTQGIAALCISRDIDEVIKALENIKCGFKNTSCPAQLAKALLQYKNTCKGDGNV